MPTSISAGKYLLLHECFFFFFTMVLLVCIINENIIFDLKYTFFSKSHLLFINNYGNLLQHRGICRKMYASGSFEVYIKINIQNQIYFPNALLNRWVLSFDLKVGILSYIFRDTLQFQVYCWPGLLGRSIPTTDKRQYHRSALP